MLTLATIASAQGQPSSPLDLKTNAWAPFVEPNYPFFSSVLDLRPTKLPGTDNNLTPRGLILNLGQNCWACFDLDLLRVTALWNGSGVTPVSMSQGSYHLAGVKAPEGQRVLPAPNGTLWIFNGLYPGWQDSGTFATRDPRSAEPDPREVGRGPLPAGAGRFGSVRIEDRNVSLRYTVHGAVITERIIASAAGGPDGEQSIRRSFALDHVPRPLALALGYAAERRPNFTIHPSTESNPVELGQRPDGLWLVTIAPTPTPVEFGVDCTLNPVAASAPASTMPPRASNPATRRWTNLVETRVLPSSRPDDAAVWLDQIPLPSANPWRRNVRLADLAFDRSGRAMAVSFDGDVWRIDGLADDTATIRWTRFASGLHEPLGLAFRGDDLFVNDRNGIWRLHDTDRNGEADEHELFSNVFTQTAETREFASDFRIAPDGSFILAKGGQQGATLGRDNGSVLRIAPDGRSLQTLGWGLRMPFIGVHPRTGQVTASDQQGNYVPATPLHLIREGRYYGYLSLLLPKEQYPAPITEPVTWIPHPVNASGASQVWLTDARMGWLNDTMIHLGYFRPELFVVRWSARPGPPQATVMSLTRDLPFPPLHGAVNPRDGLLYIIGFQIWGTVADQISGLARVRPATHSAPFPREIVSTASGLLVQYEERLASPSATNRSSYSVERWNYRRSAEYGSAHYRLDGTKGQESLSITSVHLSRDQKSVFLAIGDLRPVMQMRLGWALSSTTGRSFAGSAYFTPHEFPPFDPAREGFDSFDPAAAAHAPVAVAENSSSNAVPATPAEGRRVAELMGCVACHSNDGKVIGKVGPTWKGLFGKKRDIVGQGEVLADENYLRESIQNPPAKVPRGFDSGEIGMPSYEGVLTSAQIDALIAYLKSL